LARDKNGRRDASVGVASPLGGSAPLRGGEWPRGTLSKSLRRAPSARPPVRPSVRPSVLPKPECREATTGNGGSGGSGSTEVSICSLGLVICVLDIRARDLRCVSAISRTRARVSSPARRGAAPPFPLPPFLPLAVSFPLSVALPRRSISSAMLTYERNRSPLATAPGDPRASSHQEARTRRMAEEDVVLRGNRHGTAGDYTLRRDLFFRPHEEREDRARPARSINHERTTGPRCRGTAGSASVCVN